MISIVPFKGVSTMTDMHTPGTLPENFQKTAEMQDVA